MGMYIEIEGDYPCGKCGKPLTGWQSKELRYHGYPVEALLQTLALVPGMDGEIHNSHEGCDHFTEYAVVDGILGDPQDRRTTGEEPLPVSHTLASDSPLGRSLIEATGKPVVVEADGVRYRVVPENPWMFYHPPKRASGSTATGSAPNTADALPVPTAAQTPTTISGLAQAAGSWAGLGVFEPSSPEHGQSIPATEVDDANDGSYRQIVREAKPPKRSVENCEETRYGREVYGNARYNEALDDYERALLRWLTEYETGE